MIARAPTPPLLLLALSLAGLPSLGAQRRSDAMAGPALLAHVPSSAAHDGARPWPSTGPDHSAPAVQGESSQPQWWMPLASAAIPGAGQALLDQDRFVVYATIEGIAWLRYATERREGSRQRRAYHELASRVARAFFVTNARPGDFEYYERMQHWVESGVFDLLPATPELEPEVDTLTFNGSLWLLARRTFWEDEDAAPPRDSQAFRRAEEFYLERAIRPDFRWSWRNAQLEHDLFRRTIEESNDAYREAIQSLALVLANHVLSTVDAYVTLRLWSRTDGEREVGLVAAVPWPSRRGENAGASAGRR